MEPNEIHKRIILARTPSIATDDALTLAKYHDLALTYIKAVKALGEDGNDAEKALAYSAAWTRFYVATLGL